MSSSSVTHTLVNDQPESPNTVLRRTLNIAPPAPPDTGQPAYPVESLVNTFQPVKAPVPDVAASARKPLDNSTVVLGGAAKFESPDHLHDDVASSLSPAGLITPQALLQTQLGTKVR